MERSELKFVVEAMLFAAESPLTVGEVLELVEGVTREDVTEALAELSREYDTLPHAFKLMHVGGGYQVCTREEYSFWLDRLKSAKRKAKLSRAALETAAIVAYKQPVTKLEVESIRGVDSGATLHTLLERGLVTIRGRAKGPGRALLYGTTREFLLHFGLNELEELPKLSELKEILDEREAAGVEDDGGLPPEQISGV
ncbi:MAG: SMC-Scp complex subunit ScpB [Candidatus Eisenbacteria bacterium]|nr:SMC-Scp complex subunit ScpB [Candidatus Eisenbacteria bacterium]